MCFIRKSKQTVNSPQKIPSMVYYQAIFTLSFLLLYLFYFLFLPRMPGNSLLVEVSQYWKKKKRTTSSGLVSSLKSNRNIFSRLFVASQFRDGNLNDYFSHKNQPCPPSLSARGKLKLGPKSDIVRCLEDAPEKQNDITPSVDVVMLDGPAMLCVLKPAASGTLREYACPGCVPTLCGTSTG